VKTIVISILCFLLTTQTSYAYIESATFESFYDPSFNQSSSYSLVIAGVLALITGFAIFITGGTASPIILSIGSWLGAISSGLSGVAATNYGLALLGGGSIASGGFGVLGGASLLAAALTFTTEVIFDYTLDSVVNEYKYSRLIEQSKDLPSLPLPINISGSAIYENSIELLTDFDKNSPFSSYNKKLIDKIIVRLNNNKKTNTDLDERLKEQTLLSLLYFVTNDFKNAKSNAFSAIVLARSLQLKRTLPAFIFATSSLYDKEFDIDELTNNYLNYSILAEPEHSLTPILFSIYLDRLSLRLHDNLVQSNVLNDVFLIMNSPVLRHRRTVNYTTLISRYFIQLKLEQQKIQVLATTLNRTIRKSPKTLTIATNSFLKYERLLDGSEAIINKFIPLIDAQNRTQLSNFFRLWGSYNSDKDRLQTLIRELHRTQECDSFFGFIKCLFK